MPSDSLSDTRRNYFLIIALLYSAFILYGSLMPLDFAPFSLSTVRRYFTTAEFWRLQIGSRSDLAANVLLYIPLTFSWLGYLEYFQLRVRVWNRAAILAGAMLLSILIETAQIFLPERSCDLRDFLCNSVGAALGLAVWHLRGRDIVSRFWNWQYQAGVTGIARNILWLYLGVLTVYQAMPLDLTLSPVEIYRDMRDGGLIMIPFSGDNTDWITRLHNFSVEFFIWIIVGLLWFFSSRHSAIRIWSQVILFSVLVEILQLFVHSRVCDVTDVLSAITGSGCGIRLGIGMIRRFPVIASHQDRRHRRAWVLLGLGAFWSWYGVILWYYWFPFTFNFSRESYIKRAIAAPVLPFWSHFSGNEFSALADILRIVMFYMPLGSVLGFMAACIDKKALRRQALKISFLFLIVCAALVEFGQLFLQNRYADITDVLFGVGAAMCGYAIVYKLQTRYITEIGRPSP